MQTGSERRFLGLALGGSRRTSVVCLDFDPRSLRVAHFATRSHLHGTRGETADELLIRTANELAPSQILVDVPLSFPPCLVCEPGCGGAMECEKPAVRWMRQESERSRWGKAKFPPPYTHRPVDLLMRGRWQEDSPLHIPVEEAFGSGRAPLAARMNYLRPRLHCRDLVETNPRFALAGFADWYGVSTRELRRCRDLEHGAENRFMILNKMAERPSHAELPLLQLYMTEVVAIAKDLGAFDAFLCALVGVFGAVNLLEPVAEIDPGWGWVARPRSRGAYQESSRGLKGEA